MNWPVTIAGLLALGVVIGHFTMGRKLYLKPMLDADFDPVARRVMLSVFHYVSVFVILSCLTLLFTGTGLLRPPGSGWVVRFIAVNYLGFAIWQFVLAVTSGLPSPLTKMFQWIPFLAIDILAWLGSRYMP